MKHNPKEKRLKDSLDRLNFEETIYGRGYGKSRLILALADKVYFDTKTQLWTIKPEPCRIWHELGIEKIV